MPDPTVNLVMTATDKVSPVVKKVSTELKGFQKSVGGVGKAVPIFDKLGAATGGLINPMTLAVGAVTALGVGLVNATKAAAEEQVNIAKLDAALRANVTGWDGNTKAIESTILARERLAFDDDEQRASLALLVGATNDVSKALAIQSTAMDLARLKGISLEEASSALVKVEGGQFRALKALGIQLKAGATATEALAAVQEVAAGQAEAYSDTLIGRTEALGIAFDNLQENVGAVAVGPLTDIVNKFSAAALGARYLTGELDVASLSLEDQTALLASLTDAYPALKDEVEGYIAAAQKHALIAASVDEDRIAVAKLGDAANYTAGRFNRAYRAADDLAGALEDVKQQADDAADALAEAVYGPDILAARLDELQFETKDTETRLRELSKKKNLTREDQREINELQGKLAELQADTLTTATKLKMLGEPIPAGVLNSINRMIGKQDVYNDKVQAAINRWRRLLGLIESGGEAFGPINQISHTHKQHGGHVRPGRTYTVGEAGPETLVVGRSGGYVIPNSGGTSGGSGGGVVAVPPITIHLDGEVVYRSVERRLVRGLRTAPSMVR